MNWDDIVYALLLLGSIGVGPLMRKVENPFYRQIISAIAGLTIVLLVSGWHTLHPIFLIVVNYLITILVNKRANFVWSFVFCFSYLAFFRMCHWFGFPSPPPYTNAIQMILTIKMVGLTYEMRNNSDSKQSPSQTKYQHVDPSFLDFILYSFCHAGVLTGPYYKYRTYWDSFYLPFATNCDYIPHLIHKGKYLPAYLVAYIVFGYIFPLQYAESYEILTRSFWYRAWYMTPIFFVFRMRMYSGFVLSELQCITSGIGVYPTKCKSKPGQGPSNYDVMDESLQGLSVDYDYETIHNIDEYGADFVPTVREGMRCWNMTVQYWLAMFAYKQIPNKSLGVAATMLLSAFWHGIYPGYYLSLLTVPFVLMAEDSMARALRRDASEGGKRIFDWISWFFKMQAFSYMGMGFYLLRVDATLHFWKSIYFIGHVLIVVFYLLGRSITKLSRKPRKSKEESKEIKQN
ncbi:hypothetical protein CHUAL_002958 [Chamberlinius hualienensis]